MNKIINLLHDLVTVALFACLTTAIIWGLASITWLLFSKDWYLY